MDALSQAEALAAEGGGVFAHNFTAAGGDAVPFYSAMVVPSAPASDVEHGPAPVGAAAGALGAEPPPPQNHSLYPALVSGKDKC